MLTESLRARDGPICPDSDPIILTWPSRKSEEIQHYDVDDWYHHKETQPPGISCLRKDEPKRKNDQDHDN